jgi:hypothetical protein
MFHEENCVSEILPYKSNTIDPHGVVLLPYNLANIFCALNHDN